ncbi:MAG: site-specific DNA-methyltransferase [Anaerolineaceae bacterium]|nr:site-specific DNA-methyltransferase [Anaerolineaceae bacterium]
MKDKPLPINEVLQGDCVEIMNSLPENSVDLIFADPPYNLQLQKTLYRPNLTRVDGVDEDWDRFDDFQTYDQFCIQWLQACRRILKDSGSIWVIGSYHNIYRIGAIMQDLGFWFLNDVVWIKTNPMPNFRGVRFTNAHETLLWASKKKGAKYTFNYQAMKTMNDDLQMRSDWLLSICSGPERLKSEGKKVHPTQKPESLLYRVILSSSNPQDVVLDPFFGTGTTGAVAHKLHRNWIGIEREDKYVAAARKRLAHASQEVFDNEVFDIRDKKRNLKRIPFQTLLENGYLKPGQRLFFQRNAEVAAHIKPDGKLKLNGNEGSIHQLGKHLMNGRPCNGWDHWYFESKGGKLMAIDELRQQIRKELKIK